MKKSILLLILAVCMLLSGCGNAFAKDEFDNDQQIAASDRYASKKLETTEQTGGSTLSASKFDGRLTVWTYTSDEDMAIAVNVSVGMSKGTGKVVHVDGSGKVTRLVGFEYTSGGAKTKSSADTVVRLTKGENKIKLVGYDCEDVEMSYVLVRQ